ncbi:unnamed protein product [Discosporangium mesarthrocarpum]
MAGKVEAFEITGPGAYNDHAVQTSFLATHDDFDEDTVDDWPNSCAPPLCRHRLSDCCPLFSAIISGMPWIKWPQGPKNPNGMPCLRALTCTCEPPPALIIAC